MKPLKVRLHKTQLASWSRLHCTVVYYKRLIWIIIKEPFCISCWWRKQGRQLYFQAFNLLGDFFNLELISSSYFSCVKWNVLLETFLHNSTFFLLGAVPSANLRLNSHYRLFLEWILFGVSMKTRVAAMEFYSNCVCLRRNLETGAISSVGASP
jgi:hypothetical protein